MCLLLHQCRLALVVTDLEILFGFTSRKFLLMVIVFALLFPREKEVYQVKLETQEQLDQR